MKFYKLIIMLTFLLFILGGCVREADLKNYGINNEDTSKSDSIQSLENEKSNEIENLIENNISVASENTDKKIEEKTEEKIEEKTEDKGEESIVEEYKYPISKYIKKEFILKNETYLNDIIEILNSPYYLGNYKNMLEREKAEVQDKLDQKIKEYYSFISGNNIGYEEINNGYETYTLDYYIKTYYTQTIWYSNLDIEKVESQKDIDEFISKITMLSYSEIANLRSGLRGNSVYNTSDILSKLYTNKKVENKFIYENDYNEILKRFNKDFYYISEYMKINLNNNKIYQDNIKDEINDYIDTYEKWIKSFEESETTINNEKRYYNEESQILLYDELINKLEKLKNDINKIN